MSILTITAKPGEANAIPWGRDVHIVKDGVDIRDHVQAVEINIASDDVVRAVVRVLPTDIDIDVDAHHVTVKCSACGQPHDCSAFLVDDIDVDPNDSPF